MCDERRNENALNEVNSRITEIRTINHKAVHNMVSLGVTLNIDNQIIQVSPLHSIKDTLQETVSDEQGNLLASESTPSSEPLSVTNI